MTPQPQVHVWTEPLLSEAYVRYSDTQPSTTKRQHSLGAAHSMPQVFIKRQIGGPLWLMLGNRYSLQGQACMWLGRSLAFLQPTLLHLQQALACPDMLHASSPWGGGHMNGACLLQREQRGEERRAMSSWKAYTTLPVVNKQ